ncbi:hypothetical protein PGT21_021110 [Puccinia graminis f. sp. tritici]|uniref:Carboxylesterase type B domain-containing protein n=2 Tax=Puccinia graminis f. sp. tritici TaxID=56615 RepID=A0A5B0NP28_PUCGR|nr:hypothetical protein PGT21_021110 [Puccinia graminis f. sp. tritici]
MSASIPASSLMTVETVYGKVIGYEDLGTHETKNADLQSIGALSIDDTRVPVRKFLGIPYAQAERWKRAVPPTPWSEPIVCHKFGPSIPQPQITLFDSFYDPPLLSKPQTNQSEEKGFTVNVFSSPGVKEGDKVPVLAWIFGGGLLHGCSCIPMYDPTEWIRREATKGHKFIVVTGNYRTNLLGFLASSDLAQEDPDGMAGNYGAYDCIAYLQWVQNNIAKFGGDPDNVTAFGESAGALLLSHIMVCKEKLFRRVILQSGAVNTLPTVSWETHEKNYQELLEKACIKAESRSERLKALRAVPIEELVGYLSQSVRVVGLAEETTRSAKAVWNQGCVLTRLKEGHWSPHIESVMMGVCKDEGSLFAYMCQSHTPPGYQFSQIELLNGASYAQLDPLYRLPNQDQIDNPVDGIPLDLAQCSGSQPAGDRLFKVPMELLLCALDDTKNAETQKPLSIFVYTLEGTAVETNSPGRSFGVTHTVDIVLLFNMSHCWAPDSESAKVSATLGKTWYNYAKDGRPGLNWPEYATQSSPYKLVFQQDGESVLQDVRDRPEIEKERIKFWAEHLDLAEFWEPPVIGILDGSSSTDSSEMRSENTNKSL